MKRLRHNEPEKPKELETIHYLSGRTKLPKSLKRKLNRLQSGFLGERFFCDAFKQNIDNEQTSLYSLSLTNGSNLFQIDHLYIIGNTIFLHEIKHFKGDYLFKQNNFYSIRTKREIASPFLQLERTKSMFRQLLQQTGLDYRIVANVVFTHPECVIYTKDYTVPYIVKPQLKRYLTTSLPNGQSPTEDNLHLANKLIALHEAETIFDQQIKVDYDQLKKCINCPSCLKEMKRVTNRTVVCKHCHLRTGNEQAIVFNLRQLQHLFPQKKLTISLCLDWLGHKFSYYVVRRVLDRYFS